MGAEREVTLKMGGEIVLGCAQLEGAEIFVSPQPKSKRIRIPLEGATVLAKGNDLHVKSAGKTYVLTLGEKHAATWANAIKNPKTILQKLGVDKVRTLRIVGDPKDASSTFSEDLAKLPDLQVKKTGDTWEACLLFIKKSADLTKIATLTKPLATKNTFLWIVYPKGKPDPREADVRAAGLAAGIVDVKVASFSETHTALKFTARRA